MSGAWRRYLRRVEFKSGRAIAHASDFSDNREFLSKFALIYRSLQAPHNFFGSLIIA
jgi:hypothetical protein